MGETRHIEGNEARKESQQAPGARAPWILAQSLGRTDPGRSLSQAPRVAKRRCRPERI